MGGERGGAGELGETLRDADRSAARNRAVAAREVEGHALGRARGHEDIHDLIPLERLGRRRPVELIGVAGAVGDGLDPRPRFGVAGARHGHATRGVRRHLSGEPSLEGAVERQRQDVLVAGQLVAASRQQEAGFGVGQRRQLDPDLGMLRIVGALHPRQRVFVDGGEPESRELVDRLPGAGEDGRRAADLGDHHRRGARRQRRGKREHGLTFRALDPRGHRS